MKNLTKLIFLVVVMVTRLISYSQETDTSLNLNSLKSPVSPASTLLGVNSSEIQKPSDLTGLLVAVRNATNDFTTLPSSFALDIAPKWLLDRKSISFSDYFSNKIGKNISQTFLLSYAQVTQKDENYHGLKQGIGVKFSLLRGRIRDQKYINTISKIRSFHIMEFELEKQYDSTHVRFDDTEEFKKLDSMMIHAQTDAERVILNQLMEGIEARYNNERDMEIKAKMQDTYAEIGKLEETITPVRKGFILDFSAGTIVKYDSLKINSSSLTNGSFWLTFGYDGFKTDTADNSYFSILGLSRLIIDNADELYKSGVDERYTSWDNGIRLAYNTANQKFTISGEIISRRLYNAPAGGKNSVIKYLFSAELQISKNQRLSFSYGRDFENRVTKEGNVIGILNFVTGFFGKKKFAQ